MFAGELEVMPDGVVPALHITGHPDALLELAAQVPRVTPTGQITS